MSDTQLHACATVVEVLIPGPQGPGGAGNNDIGGYSVVIENVQAGHAIVFDGEVWENRLLAAQGDMMKAVYDTNGDGKVDVAAVADKVAWMGVTGVPTAFPPAAHGHVLSEITDAAAALAAKAPLASPALTGTPTAPTAAPGTNTGQLATTAFVQAAVDAAPGGGGSLAWGDITGKPSSFPPSAHAHALADVTGLVAALDAKAPLASPALTGTPTAPTAAPGTSTVQIATTAFVKAAVDAVPGGGGSSAWSDITGKPSSFPPSTHTHVLAEVAGLGTALDAKADATALTTGLAGKAPLASPVLTGTPIAPTAASGTNTGQIATTAFVKAAVDAIPAPSLTWSAITGKPATFSPSAHTHALADVTGLGAALNAKADVNSYYSKVEADAAFLQYNNTQTLSAAQKTRAQTNLGGTTTGRSLFTAAAAADGRTALGLGGAATANIGSSGSNLPSCGMAEITWSGIQNMQQYMRLGGTSSGKIIYYNASGTAVAEAGMEVGSGNSSVFGFITLQAAGYFPFYTQGGAEKFRVHGTGANVTGNLSVSGTVSKGGGTALIDHPLDPYNKNLRYGFTEGPRYYIVHAGAARLVGGHAVVKLDDEFGLDAGTTEAALQNLRVTSLNHQGSFDRVMSTPVADGGFEIICENAQAAGEVAWVVIGERADVYVRNIDANCQRGSGQFIPQFDKPEA